MASDEMPDESVGLFLLPILNELEDIKACILFELGMTWYLAI